jgi:hypothetical protein
MLEEEGLPAHLLPEGAGGEHPFADGLFTLPPGDYVVCATPLNENGEPSEECGPASTPATVVAEATTEVVMISQCEGDPSGALDAVLALNDPPHIDDLDIDPSKFITKCEEAVLTVTATDPDGDEMTFAWEILPGGPGNPAIADDGATAVFTTDSAGDYEVKVTVTDALGASTSLTFPIHVSFLCEAPGICKELCEAQAEEVLVDCLEAGGREDECVVLARAHYAQCIAETCVTCEDRCGWAAEAEYDECLAQGGTEDGCRALAVDDFEECVAENCEAPTCEEDCEAHAEAVNDACIAEGGSVEDCAELSRADFAQCIAENCEHVL